MFLIFLLLCLLCYRNASLDRFFGFFGVSWNRDRSALRPVWEFCLGASVVVAYTNDGYLRCLQVSYRGLWKPSWSGSGCLASEGYRDVYISPSR